MPLEFTPAAQGEEIFYTTGVTLFLRVLLGVALFGTLTSTIFLCLVWLGARRYLRSRQKQLEQEDLALPPVSILKPLHGMEPYLKENLESFFALDYPSFELLFCARLPDDPALVLARELSHLHPEIRVRIMASGDPPFPNAKVHSLEAMAQVALHDVWVITDSDVGVPAQYLRQSIPALLHKKRDQDKGKARHKEVGLLTSLYRGRPVPGLWAQLESLGMSVEMTSGVLVANMLEGMKFALGPAMIIRKASLLRIGGFEVLEQFCADDYVLGNMVDAAGYQVLISPSVIDHTAIGTSLVESLKHQIRWMKSTRFSRPRGHLGTVLTFAMPFGVLGLFAAVLLGCTQVGVALFLWAFLSRTLQAVLVGWGVVRDQRSLAACWLYPVRDLMGVFIWCASYAGSTISWRGETYRLLKGGRMVRQA